jgi:hypothetical protein
MMTEELDLKTRYFLRRLAMARAVLRSVGGPWIPDWAHSVVQPGRIMPLKPTSQT